MVEEPPLFKKPDDDMTVMSDEISSWLNELQEGTAPAVVMSEGKGYSFNCDGQAHYLYENDVTRREPNGRFKRVYTGKVSDGHVIYKGATREIPCKSSHVRWERTRHVTCRIPGGARKDAGRPGDTQGRDERLSLPDAKWEDPRATIVH